MAAAQRRITFVVDVQMLNQNVNQQIQGMQQSWQQAQAAAAANGTVAVASQKQQKLAIFETQAALNEQVRTYEKYDQTLSRVGGTTMSISFASFMLAKSLNDSAIGSEKLTKAIQFGNTVMTAFGAITQIVTGITQLVVFWKKKDAEATRNATNEEIRRATLSGAVIATEVGKGAGYSASQGAKVGGGPGAAVSVGVFLGIALPLVLMALAVAKGLDVFDTGGRVRQTGPIWAKEGEEVITESESRRRSGRGGGGGGMVVQNLTINSAATTMKQLSKELQNQRMRGA